MSWNFARAAGSCTLQGDAPDVYYLAGSDCGLRGEWAYDAVSQCLTLTRPGLGGSHGNMSICASAEGGANSSSSSSSFGTYDTGAAPFLDLSLSVPELNGATGGAHGAVAVTASVPPGTQTTLTITFGWFFPERDHFGKVFGNYYKNLFSSSADAAFGSVAPGAARTGALAGVVADVVAMQSPFHQSTLEPWLQDHLVNSLSHIRTAMWFDHCPHCHKSADNRTKGFWRQWEAFDCPDIDSIHNDGERHVPYLMFFPDSTRNKMAAWAGNQGADGMLAEQIHNADPDSPEGRIMADSTSMFIMYVLELLRWDADDTTLELYYPAVKRAAEWQMNVSADFGVPLELQTTYDILGFTSYQLSSYSSVFHVMAMEAAAELARAADDGASRAAFAAAATRGRNSLDTLQWVGQNTSTFEGQPGVYCDMDYEYVGANLSVGECARRTFGLQFFMDAGGRGDCYACRGGHPLANQSGYVLYTKTGAVRGSWAAASNNCTDRAGCATQHGVFADTLYAQVLAYSAGLGTIVSSADKLREHLATELATNCAHAEGTDLEAGCGKGGMVILTGRSKVGVTDWQVWEGGPPNHASLALRAGAPPAEALANFKQSATSWSQRVNDQWNTAGIKDTDGYPTVTSHYGFHMVSWHVPLAMSGQLADLTVAGNRSLEFTPALPPPYSLPIMLPGVLGTLSSKAAGQYEVALTVGQLQLDVLTVDGHRAPGAQVILSTGAPVSWSA